jgi:hypothetical protein
MKLLKNNTTIFRPINEEKIVILNIDRHLLHKINTMKKLHKKTATLMIAGLAFTSGTPALARYIQMSDLYQGVFTGLGIGLLLVALMVQAKYRRSQSC